jgi:hypothetical protein
MGTVLPQVCSYVCWCAWKPPTAEEPRLLMPHCSKMKSDILCSKRSQSCIQVDLSQQAASPGSSRPAAALPLHEATAPQLLLQRSSLPE